MARADSRESPLRVGVTRLPPTLTDFEIVRHFHVTDRLRTVLRTARESRAKIALAVQAGAVLSRPVVLQRVP